MTRDELDALSSHELHDLAVRFVESGWSLKHSHRLIVLSATYRQISTDDEQRHKIDPDNLLLWRQKVQRLDAGTLRPTSWSDRFRALGRELLRPQG